MICRVGYENKMNKQNKKIKIKKNRKLNTA